MYFVSDILKGFAFQPQAYFSLLQIAHKVSVPVKLVFEMARVKIISNLSINLNYVKEVFHQINTVEDF